MRDDTCAKLALSSGEKERCLTHMHCNEPSKGERLPHKSSRSFSSKRWAHPFCTRARNEYGPNRRSSHAA